MLVAVVFLDVVVIVPGVASVSRLFVAISRAIAVLVLIILFHINAVLSLSPFFVSLPLARFGFHLFVVDAVPCLLSFYYLLMLSLRFLSLFCNMFVIFGLCTIIIGFVVVVVVVVVVIFCCTYGVGVCMNFWLRSSCGRTDSGITSGFDIVCFNLHCQPV